MKKALPLLLTLVLALAALTGCAGQSSMSATDSPTTSAPAKTAETTAAPTQEPADSNFNETGYPIVNEPITLALMGIRSSIQGEWKDLELFKVMEEMTNIHLEFTTYPAENYQEMKNLALVSGTYPDFFYAGNLTTSDEVTYGGQGVLVPLNDLIDRYGVNLTALFAQDDQIRSNITTPDGNIYSLPLISDVPWGWCGKIWINEVWMDNLDLTMPETIDDLYAVLKAFKTEDANGNGDAGDEIPYSFYGTPTPLLMTAYGLLSDKQFVQDDTIIYSPVTEEYKQYLLFMHTLYDEQLLDNEGYSQTVQQMTAKGDAQQLGMFSAAASFLNVTDYEYADDYPALPPLTSQWNDTKMWPRVNTTTRGAFAITDKNEYPAETIRWVDYFYSVDGGFMMSQGPEGMAYEWNSDHTSWSKIVHEGFNTTEEYRGGVITPNCGSNTPGWLSPEWVSKMDYPFPMMPREVNDQYVPYLVAGYPLVYYTVEDQSRLDVLNADIDVYVSTMQSKFITGEESLDGWDEYISTLEKMGVGELTDIYQRAYDIWNGGN